MKVCVIQPGYSFDERDLDSLFSELLSRLDECDESLDVIALPEYSDAPADVKGKAGFYDAVEKYSDLLLEKAMATAKRCSALVFVNCGYKTDEGVRNTTHAIDRGGNIVGRYFKAHPAPSEVKCDAEGGHELDVKYSYEFREPYVLEIEGLRFGFLTCYDFYFYESFARMARENLDIIIGCSLQRTDTHEALSIINKFLCYQTNAYLIRASVSLGEESALCGCSMVVSPRGEEILNMKSQAGLGICEIDPKAKYYKPAGHMGKPKAHYEYIEEGRRPWLYRNGGPSCVPNDKFMKYPRLCAHRGFNTVAPENSLPAYGEAVALGANEIEFDIWSTKDGVLVSSHDPTLERVSDGEGKIYEKTYAELLELDFGIKHGKGYKGLKILTFEEILQKFAARVIMNIHVKIWDRTEDAEMLPEIARLLHKYDCEEHIYFMSSNENALREVREYAPNLRICLGCGEKISAVELVNKAIDLGADKLQFYRPAVEPTREAVELAHKNGIRCNLCEADIAEEAREYFDMGIDTVMTNDFLNIYNATKDYLDRK